MHRYRVRSPASNVCLNFAFEDPSWLTAGTTVAANFAAMLQHSQYAVVLSLEHAVL